MAELAGSMVDHYRILAPIGSGGFATVYRARDERLGSEVAIKILAENHALDPEIRSRFLSEARVLRQVSSRHIITLFDVGETERLQPYLVLALAGGGDLRRRVEAARRDGRSPTDRDVRVVANSLADALSTIHRYGIVHRDVSPGNLLIVGRPDPATADGDDIIGAHERIVLADLGYAKDLSQHSGLTVGGGTSGFNAPEQRTGLGRIDARADVFAAGALMCWLLTGQVHDAGAALDTLPDIDDRWTRALGTSMASRPDRRQADMETWIDSLPLGERSDPDTASESDGRAGAGLARRRRWAVVFACCAALAVAVVAMVARTRPDEPSPVTTTLDDGRVRVGFATDDVSVAIFGPSTMTVGQPATFEAAIRGGRDYFWLSPGGVVTPAAPSITLTATEPGVAVVSLTVVDGDDHPTSVSRRVEVAE